MLRLASTSVCRSSVLETGPTSRHPLSSAGFRWGRFPSFTGTMGCSDPPHPSRLASVLPVARRYQRCTCSAEDRATGASHATCFGHPSAPGRDVGDCGVSQVPRVPLCMRAPLKRPRWDLHARSVAACRCCLGFLNTLGSHDCFSFGARSRGPHARCLRFAVRVAQRRRGRALPIGLVVTHHARLASGW